MAGHSHASNVAARKGAQDAKRAKKFLKVVREITVATKLSGPDFDTNPRLRLAVEKARILNMPKDNIERAIKKASGNIDNDNYFEITYEGYGIKNVAFIVKTLTNNVNRTASNVRSYFTKASGSLGVNGSVSYLFDFVGIIKFFDDRDKSLIEEILLETCAENLYEINSEYIVTVTPNNLDHLKAELIKVGINNFNEIKREFFPQSFISLENNEDTEKINLLIDLLEDDDDVQEVVHNFL